MGRLVIRWAAPRTRRGHRGPRRDPRSLPYRPTAPAPPRARPGPLLTHYDTSPLHCRIPGLGRAAARAAAPSAAAPDGLQAAKNRSAGNASSALRRNPGVRGLPRQTARFQRGSREFSHRRASAAVRKRATGRLRFPARRHRACARENASTRFARFARGCPGPLDFRRCSADKLRIVAGKQVLGMLAHVSAHLRHSEPHIPAPAGRFNHLPGDKRPARRR